MEFRAEVARAKIVKPLLKPETATRKPVQVVTPAGVNECRVYVVFGVVRCALSRDVASVHSQMISCAQTQVPEARNALLRRPIASTSIPVPHQASFQQATAVSTLSTAKTESGPRKAKAQEVGSRLILLVP